MKTSLYKARDIKHKNIKCIYVGRKKFLLKRFKENSYGELVKIFADVIINIIRLMFFIKKSMPRVRRARGRAGEELVKPQLPPKLSLWIT